MEKSFKNIYQFKITLKDTSPPVWRRIQVPENYSLFDLHVAIQDAMGWMDYHLHAFNFPSPITAVARKIGFRDFGYHEGTRIGTSIEPEDDGILDDKKEKMSQWFSLENPKANYTYDFGDTWEHQIVLEKILPREKGSDYPICIAGKRMGPPEDCGGVWGFQALLERKHHSQAHYDKIYDAEEEFYPNSIVFHDPGERVKEIIEF